VVKYRVYRNINDFSDISSMGFIAEISAGHFSYIDNNISFDNGYYYAVTAVDELGHENPAVGAVYVFVYIPGSIAGTLYNTDRVTRITGKNIQVSAYTLACNGSGWTKQTTVDLSTGDYMITGLPPGPII
jgi:hypothetical protein